MQVGDGRTLNWSSCAQISSLPALNPYKPSQDQNVSLSGGRDWVTLVYLCCLGTWDEEVRNKAVIPFQELEQPTVMNEFGF